MVLSVGSAKSLSETHSGWLARHSTIKEMGPPHRSIQPMRRARAVCGGDYVGVLVWGVGCLGHYDKETQVLSTARPRVVSSWLRLRVRVNARMYLDAYHTTYWAQTHTLAYICNDDVDVVGG